MTITTGDCVEVMAAMEPDSIDAIVTDPPYGLEFMGKEWDAPVMAGHSQPNPDESGIIGTTPTGKSHGHGYESTWLPGQMQHDSVMTTTRDVPRELFDDRPAPPKRRNTHPTVKPTDLMRHLVRLVTPQGGTVLDPFLGSGSTAIAATMEGFAWIGIEREADYVRIAEQRLEQVQHGLGL